MMKAPNGILQNFHFYFLSSCENQAIQALRPWLTLLSRAQHVGGVGLDSANAHCQEMLVTIKAC